MAFNWEAAWRKAETVTFSDEVVVTPEGREFPAAVMDGFGSVFRFVNAGEAFVKFEKVGERNCFKVFRPDMTVRNVARDMAEKVANGEVKK